MKLPPNFDKELFRSEIALSVAIVSLMSVGFSAWLHTDGGGLLLENINVNVGDVALITEDSKNPTTSFSHALVGDEHYFYNAVTGELTTVGYLTYNLILNTSTIESSSLVVNGRISIKEMGSYNMKNACNSVSVSNNENVTISSELTAGTSLNYADFAVEFNNITNTNMNFSLVFEFNANLFLISGMDDKNYRPTFLLEMGV